MNVFTAIADTFYKSKDYSSQKPVLENNIYWCEICKHTYQERKLTYVTYVEDGVQKSTCLCRKCLKKTMMGVPKSN